MRSRSARRRGVGGSGEFPVDQLADLFGEPVELGDAYEATTLGGLVSEIEGRIPLAGEVVLLEPIGSADGDCGFDWIAGGGGGCFRRWVNDLNGFV